MNIDKMVHNCRPTSELTLKDRCDKVSQAKRNSTCRKCGKTGHWAVGEAFLQRNQQNGKDKGKRKGEGKSKYTNFEVRIGMFAVAMKADYRHIKDHPAPVTSISPKTSVLSPRWVRGPGAIRTRIFRRQVTSIVYHDTVYRPTRDPGPGRGVGAEKRHR